MEFKYNKFFNRAFEFLKKFIKIKKIGLEIQILKKLKIETKNLKNFRFWEFKNKKL